MDSTHGKSSKLPFERAEYQDRVRKVKEKMEAEAVDVMFITSPTSMYYLTGYDAFSFYMPQFLIFPLDRELFMIPRKLDEKSVIERTWLNPDRVRPYDEKYVDSYYNYRQNRHPIEFVIKVLRDEGLADKRFGLEMDGYYCKALYYEKLKSNLPNATFKDMTQLIPRIYLVKSEREIEYMKEASQIVEEGMQAALEAIKVGVREYDVAAEILSAMTHSGGCPPSFPPLLQTTPACHITWTDKEIKPGASITIEIAGCRRRYHSPMCRTVVVDDKSSDKVKKAKEITQRQINAHQRALQTIEPGIRAEEVAKEANKIFPERSSRVGYPAGLGFPPDWGEHTASFKEGDLTILKPNMTFHTISTLSEPFMIEFSETIRVTENGYEVLADFPRKLFIK